MVVVELIAAMTTKAGLKIESALDTRAYEKGIKVSDAEALDIQGDPFHPNGTTLSAREQLPIAAVNVADVLMLLAFVLLIVLGH